MALPISCELKRLAARLQRAPGKLQLGVQFQQLKIIGGNLADHRGEYRFAVPVGIQQIGTRAFGGAAQLSPEIDLEREQIERGLPPIAVLTGDKRRRQRK